MKRYERYFTTETVGRIQRLIEAEPDISRGRLSRQVCEWLNWRSANGKLQEVSCRKALLDLHRLGRIVLPEQTRIYSFQTKSDVAAGHVQVQRDLIQCDLDQLGKIDIVIVPGRGSVLSDAWNRLMDSYHYLGRGPLCGAQLRYLIKSDIYGYLGGLSFSAATLKLKPREEWIGWSACARSQNLHFVVCNSRFLIAPFVQVPNLASHVLSLSLQRVSGDYQERYGYSPVLVETFVDDKHYNGSCYKAANFSHIGYTAARSTGYANGKIPNGRKQIYVYPLHRCWRSILCREPERGFFEFPGIENPKDWVEEEFGRLGLYDSRIRDRLFVLARDFFDHPGELVPQVCKGSEAKTKAAYRFFDNKNIDMQVVLKPHIESTIERMRQHKVVLAVQDSTSLNYTGHSSDDMGPINTKANKSVGLIVHDTVAFSCEGTPLGVLDVQCWSRDPKEAGKRHKRKQLPIEQKESIKWINSFRAVSQIQRHCSDTMVVSVGDRESDIYELFEEALKDSSGAKLLVRAMRDRRRQTPEQVDLWELMSDKPVAGKIEVHIPRRNGQSARTACVQIQFGHVVLEAPKRKNGKNVDLWAVYAKEVGYGSEVKSPIEWMLLTTVKTQTFEEACEMIGWYGKRWGIEVYHRVLKSGCRIEDRHLGNIERLEACLAIDFVVAWRIFYLTKAGRETPELACNNLFIEQEEWEVLWSYFRDDPLPSEPPAVGIIMIMIAQLGGYLNRKSDGPPGITTMWRGLEVLRAMVAGYKLAMSEIKNRSP